MKFFEKNEKDNICLMIIVGIISLLFLLPLVSTFLYSIDDYYLIQTYKIDLQNVGYNYYSTGRFVEGIIAEILSFLNLLPINKPMGQLFFIATLSYMGIYVAEVIGIEKQIYKIGFALIFVLNPFFGELYYYSTVTVFCGFAILFLLIGFRYSIKCSNRFKIRYLLIAVFGYYCSLATYQIFYPIVLYIIVGYFIKEVIIENIKCKDFFRKHKVEIIIYFLSFIIFYIVMKVSFCLKPPSLQYDMDSVSTIISRVVNKEYWQEIFTQLKLYLFRDNAMQSVFLFELVLFVASILMIKRIFSNQERCPIYIYLIKTIGLCIIIFIGVVMTLGFGILGTQISYRSFTSFGVFEALLIYLAFPRKKEGNIGRIISLIGILCIIANGTRMGRVALDTYRLNIIENNLANRVVMRLEETENFNPNAKLVIIGNPTTGKVGNVYEGDYNTPALAQFSKVLMINEISGYNFQLPTNEDYEKAYTFYNEMESWPSEKSIFQMGDVYVVKFS